MARPARTCASGDAPGSVAAPPDAAGRLVVRPEDPSSPEVLALIGRHLDFARRLSPPEHVHALQASGLLDPAVTFFGARSGGRLVAIGALRQLDESHGELKSMHTAEEDRGGGAGRAMLEHLLSVATQRNYSRVSLETGTQEGFAPARRLYARAGFRPCAPFGEYTVNPYSVCMSLEIPVAK